MFWVLIYMVNVTVCSCLVTYAFQIESTLYNCLNVKELLAHCRCEIWSLSDGIWTRTQNHLVHKWTLNHLAKLPSLAKWLSVRLPTKWLFWVRIQLQSFNVSLFKLADVVYGPFEVIPMKAGKFDVPEYVKVVEHFNVVKDLERNSLL